MCITAYPKVRASYRAFFQDREETLIGSSFTWPKADMPLPKRLPAQSYTQAGLRAGWFGFFYCNKFFAKFFQNLMEAKKALFW